MPMLAFPTVECGGPPAESNTSSCFVLIKTIARRQSITTAVPSDICVGEAIPQQPTPRLFAIVPEVNHQPSNGARKTRLIALCIGALALTASAAGAADIRMPAKGPAFIPAPAPVISWAGFYIGGQIGGGWGSSNWVTNATLPNEQISTKPDGWLGGGQAGFRFEVAPDWLLGVEVSGSWADLSDTVNSVFPGRTRGTQLRSLFAVTGQVAHSWGPWLVYAKGGWATGDVRRFANNNNPGGLNVTWTEDPNGWTAGVGFEYLIGTHVSVGAEYAYYSLDLSNITRPNTGGIPVTAGSSSFDIHTIMARINFRFGPL
jgi:outer membrane immunogenic protein